MTDLRLVQSRAMKRLAFLILVLCCTANSLMDCNRYSACGVIEYTLTTAEVEEGSGESGVEDYGSTSVPLLAYDEAIERRLYSPPPPLNASVESKRHVEMCRCADDVVCPLHNETAPEQAIRLDAYVELRMCRPTAQLFPRRCRGDRGVVRVIGAVDGATRGPITTLASYNETLLFCRCDSGRYARKGTEPWKDGYFQAIKYGCA